MRSEDYDESVDVYRCVCSMFCVSRVCFLCVEIVVCAWSMFGVSGWSSFCVSLSMFCVCAVSFVCLEYVRCMWSMFGVSAWSMLCVCGVCLVSLEYVLWACATRFIVREHILSIVREHILCAICNTGRDTVSHTWTAVVRMNARNTLDKTQCHSVTHTN
jgi:hypothetical protein